MLEFALILVTVCVVVVLVVGHYLYALFKETPPADEWKDDPFPPLQGFTTPTDNTSANTQVTYNGGMWSAPVGEAETVELEDELNVEIEVTTTEVVEPEPVVAPKVVKKRASKPKTAVKHVVATDNSTPPKAVKKPVKKTAKRTPKPVANT